MQPIRVSASQHKKAGLRATLLGRVVWLFGLEQNQFGKQYHNHRLVQFLVFRYGSWRAELRPPTVVMK